LTTAHEVYLESDNEDELDFFDTITKGESLDKYLKLVEASYPHVTSNSSNPPANSKENPFQKWSLFKSNTGWFSPLVHHHLSDFQEYGSAIVLYF
jgi:hypothetical protein